MVKHIFVINSFHEALDLYPVLYGVQFIYTNIVWGTLLNRYVIEDIINTIILIISVLALLHLMKFNCMKNNDDVAT